MTTGANYEQPRPKRPISQSAESLASWCPCDHCRDVNAQQNGPSQPKSTLVSLDGSISSVPVPLAIAPKERSFSRTKSKRTSQLRVGPLAPGQTPARFDPTEVGEARQLRAYMKLCARRVNLASIHQVMLSDSDTNGFKEYHTAAQERVTKIRNALRRERNSIVRVAMGLARAISDLTPSILFLVTTIPLLEDWVEPIEMDQITLDTDMDAMLEELQRISWDIDPENIGILCAIDRAVVTRGLRKPHVLRADDHQAKVAGHLYRYYASHKTMSASISADSYRQFSPRDEVLNTDPLSSWERYQIFIQRLPAPGTYRYFPPKDKVLDTDPLSSWERQQISSQRLPTRGKVPNDMYERTILHDVATHIDDAFPDAVRRFRYLLRREDPRRPHINSRDYLGRSALHILSARGLTAATRELVDAGADPNAVDCVKRTPLHWSIAQGAGALLPLVIPDKVTPCALHQIDAAQSSPMHLAAQVYETNPDRGISVTYLGAIHQFSLQHRDDSFQHLENPIDTETEASKQRQGWGMLHFAAANGWTETLQALLDNGIVVDDYHSRSGHTALSIAALHGNVKAVQYLLSRHGFLSPNDRDNGRNAISYAAENGNMDILQLLLRHPRCAMLADHPDNAGCTPLFHAVTAGRKDAVQLLLQAGGANPRIATNANATPLSVALEGKDEEMIRMLKEPPPPPRAPRAAPPSSLTPSLRRLIGPDAPPRMPAPAFLSSGRGSRQGRASDGASMWGLDPPPGFDGLERRTSDASLRSFNSFTPSLYAMSEYRADRGAPSARSSLSFANLMVETVYDLPYRQNSQTRHDLPWISQEDEYQG